MPTTYTTKQAASKLQKSPNTLRNWSEQDTDIVEAPQDAQNAQDRTDSALAVRVALDDLEKRFDAKLAVLQQVKEPSFTMGLLLGVVGMGIIFLVGLGLAVLYGGFR